MEEKNERSIHNTNLKNQSTSEVVNKNNSDILCQQEVVGSGTTTATIEANTSAPTQTTNISINTTTTTTTYTNNNTIKQQCRPESINLTSYDSSINLLSNATQAPDSTSLKTNNSSDCVVTYDSDSYWPLSQVSSASRINTNQGSESQLDRQAANECSAENDIQSTKILENNNNNMDNVSLNGDKCTNNLHFIVGSASDTESNHADNMTNFSEIHEKNNDNQLTDKNNITNTGQEIIFDNEDLDDNHQINNVDNNNDNNHIDDEDDDESYDPHKQVIVGICAMEKKAQSKPMKEILRRLEDYFEYIRTLVFEESVILNKPIEEWPLCDCLISFHSKGFPLSKAIEYARLRKPFLVNDLDIQYDIQDRRKVYKILEEADIELPRYAVLDRDSANLEDRELIESDDHIEVANFVFNKPFVEKPISAEDHNICIYYPAHAGGGSQRLFRKIGCRSSVYSNESHVRKTGSYIYEEFMPTDGTDVKVYTAGPDYAHAEARKSPALDGKVERDMDGKEIRYPVILTNREKLIARKVCLAFKQTVCGFDLLRANGQSYVCDVNGFSFVKSSMKYYEDCSKILGNMMLRALAPQLHIPWSIPFQLDDPPIVPTTFGRMMELRCVVAIIRHGDRTPKQKMKLEVKHPKFFELYEKYGNTKNGQAKLKKPKQLQEVLDIARYLLGELPDEQPVANEVIEPRVKLKQLKSVLEMYGHFSGINRKVQLKYQPHGRPRRSSSEDEATREPSLVLILKWGGELTPAGRVQAEDLGRCFRRLYPASGDYSGPQGLGLLRLHSTFRHDLKIYASDEGRVQMTAAAFAKGFLALEGELTPILFQMVKSANTNGLLDNDCESSKCQKIVKERLHDIMQKNYDLVEEDMEILNPTNAPSIKAACKFISNPYQACEKVHKLIKELNALIRSKRQDNCYTQEYHLYHGETWDLLQRRWAKLEKDFKFKRSKRFDISKIPDIYDCIKYDLQHNQHTLQFQFAHELHAYAKALADIVIPQEYGMTPQEKLMISLGTCSPLLRKIQADLLRNADSTNDDETESVNRLDPKYSHGVSSPDRHVRTRLYFTSESHIHSLVTALQYGGLLDVKRDEQWQRSMEFLSAISELNYLSQIVIMLYEDPTKESTSDDRFHVEIHFSSGVINRISQQANMPTEPQGPGFRPHLHNKTYSNASSTNTTNKDQQLDQNQDLSKNDNSPCQTPTNMLIRSKLSSMNLSAKQQAADTMIKEEPTDDERSNDDPDSKGNSKSSSVCITPKKSSPINLKSCLTSNETNQELESLDSATPTQNSTLTSRLNNNETNAIGFISSIEDESLEKLSNQKSNPRYLSRSYSANTPISLQDLFKKTEVYMNRADDVLEVTNENVTKDQEEIFETKSSKDNNNKINEKISINKLIFNEPNDIEKLRDESNKTNNEKPPPPPPSSSSTKSQLQQQQKNTESINILNTIDNSIQDDNNCYGNPSDQSTSSFLQYPRIPEKNNWKTYEQYLASEIISTPQLVQHHHHHHHLVSSSGGSYYHRHRRCCNNQLDNQQLINLPPTYHTIHHWNFSPSNQQQQQQNLITLSPSQSSSTGTASGANYQRHYHNQLPSSSISMSTSPQQLIATSPANASSGNANNTMGSNIHQRYLAHKQQQQQQYSFGHRQFFTMSASMPIQYKSNTNPRACSVADVSQYCGGPSSLISTAVISGSSPELVAVCPYSPNIRPLETLHNELSLKPFIDFITRLTRNHRSSNISSLTENNNNNNNHGSLTTVACNSDSTYSDNVTVRSIRSSSRDITNTIDGHNIKGDNSNPILIDDKNKQEKDKLQKPMTNPNSHHNKDNSNNNNNNNNYSNSNCNLPLGLSPGNSLSNSLIWSGPPSSFASSPNAVLDLWSKLELEDDEVDGGSGVESSGGLSHGNEIINNESIAIPNSDSNNHTSMVINNNELQQEQQLKLNDTASNGGSSDGFK